MSGLAVLGLLLLALAGLLLFIGLCLGDRCDWSDDGKTIFWMIVIGLALLFFGSGNTVEITQVAPAA